MKESWTFAMTQPLVMQLFEIVFFFLPAPLHHPTCSLFPVLIFVSFHDTTDHSLHKNGFERQEDDAVMA